MKDLKEPVKTINVSKEFLKDFNDYCEWMQFTEEEVNDMRDCIRAHFESSGPWLQKQMLVKRWAEENWNHLPSLDEVKIELTRMQVDASMFEKLGYMILLDLCYELSN